MLFKTLRKINKNILTLVLVISGITGCDNGNQTEDLSLRIQVNKNHAELSRYTVCVDNVAYVEDAIYTAGGLSKTNKYFCSYDSLGRPVEETMFELRRYGNEDPKPNEIKLLEWNSENQSLVIMHYVRGANEMDPDQCLDPQNEFPLTRTCLRSRKEIIFQ